MLAIERRNQILEKLQQEKRCCGERTEQTVSGVGGNDPP